MAKKFNDIKLVHHMIINNMYFLLLFQVESNRGKEAPEYSCMLHSLVCWNDNFR